MVVKGKNPPTGGRGQGSSPPPRCGVGRARAHHGELLQGVFPDGSGRNVRALVTLPFRGRGSEAAFEPSVRGRTITVVPSWRTKALAAAGIACLRLTGRPVGGVLTIRSDVPPGMGLGSSTSDVTAAVRAVADSVGVHVTDGQVADMAATAEGATDSTMIDTHPVLFAQREGRVLEYLPDLPPLLVVGCNTDTDGDGVDTVAHPVARYSATETAVFRRLLHDLRAALHRGDAEAVAQVADHSGRINERFLPKQGISRIRKIAESTGGLGVQVAHSGTVVGVIFDPSRSNAATDAFECADLLGAAGFRDVVQFSTAGEANPG